jgi:hypothetical protein
LRLYDRKIGFNDTEIVFSSKCASLKGDFQLIRILFVCHGNICRSPMAEYYMKDQIEKKGLSQHFFLCVGSGFDRRNLSRDRESCLSACEGKALRAWHRMP